ncbi:hypothetical protein DPMN_173967 [Dreissena polymorpha]|uniref:Uncharacterized protein n=1 Tax=Dreissena polymorpha TaxID=45954 RepID=A0A9D4IEP9_DREPO|nr:hypothetical protein DPMN_173967 [Dreissena polymorpha]
MGLITGIHIQVMLLQATISLFQFLFHCRIIEDCDVALRLRGLYVLLLAAT